MAIERELAGALATFRMELPSIDLQSHSFGSTKWKMQWLYAMISDAVLDD